MDGQKDRQIDNSDFTEPSATQKSLNHKTSYKYQGDHLQEKNSVSSDQQLQELF